MSTSAVDSLQNGLTVTIAGVYLKKVPLVWVRLLVLILTVPCLVVSLQVRRNSLPPSGAAPWHVSDSAPALLSPRQSLASTPDLLVQGFRAVPTFRS